MVDTFYEKVQKDQLIGPIFNAVIKDNWPTHLATMYRFWNTLLLYKREYSGSPFSVHAPLPITKVHFDRWVLLYTETIDELFVGLVAEDAKQRANHLAVMFEYKMTHGKLL